MSSMKAEIVEERASRTAAGDRADGGVASGARTVRVLAWSGPEGWRSRHPRLVAASRGPRGESDAGFSLIELMVVLLIMAILLAIAIPTFLGTTGAADDRSAQSDLITAFTDAKTQYQNWGQTYGTSPTALATALEGAQLDLDFVAGTAGNNYVTGGSSGSESKVSVAVSTDGNGAVLAAFSVPGNCFYVVDNTQAITGAVAATYPYVNPSAPTTPVTTTRRSISGAIGLPTSAGTSYVTVSGDLDKNDCNANTPMASGSQATAVYQIAGFAPAVDN